MDVVDLGVAHHRSLHANRVGERARRHHIAQLAPFPGPGPDRGGEQRVGRVPALDRAFIRAQVTNTQYLAAFIQGLSGVTQRPEVQALLSSAEGLVQSELTKARALQVSAAKADSAAADSAWRLRRGVSK